MITRPAIKFIGEKEMVIPIISGGYLLSHKDYVNFYYPTIIEVIDQTGRCIRFRKAKVLDGLQWLMSIQHISLLQRIQPELIEKPFLMEAELLKEKVCRFIHNTPKNRGLIKEEKDELLEKVQACNSHRTLIQTIASVSYWK